MESGSTQMISKSDLLHVGGALARSSREKGTLVFRVKWQAACSMGDRVMDSLLGSSEAESTGPHTTRHS